LELPPEAPLVADGSDADVTGAPDMAENQAPEDAIAKPLPRPDGGAGDQIAELLEKGPLETANGDAAKAPAAAPAPVQTAKAVAGDVVLQLSSVKSEAAAAQEWKRLQTAHPALLGKLPLTLETAAVQGTTYYRVQTGPFASRDAAAEVCSQLKARNQDCLVKQR
jgi:cell division septation protein DedD